MECVGPCGILLFGAIMLNVDQILNFFIAHGILKGKINCPKCGENELELNRTTLHFRCMKTVTTRKQRPRKCDWPMGLRRHREELEQEFYVPVETRDAATLLAIIHEWVYPGTTIMSDCWRAYKDLDRQGFDHFTVNHSVNFVDPDTGAHTNTVERSWREVRATVPRYWVRKHHFPGYLAEYHFKRKYSRSERIHHFFVAAARLYPPKY